MKGKVIVVGGGIVGLCSAFYLQREGWNVTIIDKGDFRDSCSFGNAGMIVPSHFTPLAAPGMISQGIRWMFNSKSPFYVKPSLDWSMISWGLKFFKYSTHAHVEKSAPFLRDLNLESSRLYHELSEELNQSFGLREKGILILYKTEKTQEEEIHLAEKAQALGLNAEVLNQKEVQALEPHLLLNVLGGVHYKCDAHLYPVALMENLKLKLISVGVQFIKNQEISKVKILNKTITQLCNKKGEVFTADHFVFASGAWLQQTCKIAGLNVPVMPGKGYSFMTSTFEGRLNYPALLLEDRVAITPMNGQVRVSGTMELAAINHKINQNKVQGIVNAVPKYYSDINLDKPQEKDTWFGFRPCSPDGLPYLGASQSISNLVIAGGLGMMGLSLGPAVGSTVCGIINKKSRNISIFNPERFQ